MTWMSDPFPPRLSFGIECNPEWETTVVETRSGWESRNLDWADARHTYDASFAIRSLSDHQDVREHFHKARGKTHSWPLLDPSDNDVTVAQGGAIDADDSDGSLQLIKRYGTGGFAYERKITRPFGVKVYFTGILKTITTDYLLDTNTGILIALDTDVVAANVTWSGQFYVPCRYDTKKLPVRITNKSEGEFLISSDNLPIVEVRE